MAACCRWDVPFPADRARPATPRNRIDDVSMALAAGPGRYGWDGGLGTSWSSDPATGVIALLMTQRLPPAVSVFDDFWTLVSEAAQ